MSELRDAIECSAINAEIEIAVLEGQEYDAAIVGQDMETLALVYSYDKINEVHEAMGMSPDEAREFTDYNTIRAIPYMPGVKPIVVRELIY